MIGELVVTQGPDKGRRFELQIDKPTIMGRGTDTQITLTDPRISRKQCLFLFSEGKITVSDAGSTGGTLVNNKPITEHLLMPGDIIRIGDSEIRFMHANANEQTIQGTAPPSRLAAPTGQKAAVPKLTELVGKELAHFKIKKLIATGSTGMVFLADDTEGNQEVALKVLSPEYASSEDDVHRFIRGMKTMLPISHPNLVKTHAAGRAGPFCWISMEYVDGENMASVIQKIGTAGMLDWRYAFRVAFDVSFALQEAYYHQIIHRNITPTNIMIRSSDKCIKLGDMMLAKALEGSLAEDITKPGQLIGVLAYMAPERTVDSSRVDTRSDIYSLGATVYALLTGRPPFEGKSLPELIKNIRTEMPIHPKRYQLSVPDGFQDLVMRMLAKRPEDRFESTSEVLRDLDRIKQFNGVHF